CRSRKAGEILCSFRISGAEERVGQSDAIDLAGPGIIGELWIDKEIDRHLDLLPRAESLLIETEALDLVEINPGFGWRHVKRRVSDVWLVGQVLGGEDPQLFFAEVDLALALLRLEPPRQAGRYIGGEPHGHDTVADRLGWGIYPLGGAAEAGGRAEQAIERHGKRDERRHHGDDGGQSRARSAFFVSARRRHGRRHWYPYASSNRGGGRLSHRRRDLHAKCR